MNIIDRVCEHIEQTVGKDMEGWDKPGSPEEIAQFLKFGGNDRSIETVDLSPAAYAEFRPAAVRE